MPTPPFRTAARALLALGAALASPAPAAAQAFTEEVRLTAGDTVSGDNFGASVALQGDTLMVGAPRADDGARPDTGAVIVFTYDGALWSQQAKLRPSDVGAPGETLFGNELALAGDTLLVGAESAVYVFVRDASGWSEQARLVASPGSMNLTQGLALEGDTAVVGVLETLFPPVSAVHVLTRTGSLWSHSARLLGSDTEAGDFFGTSLALSSDTLLVGSPSDEVALPGQGSVTVFVRAGTLWNEQAKLVASVPAEGALFGFSVGLEGDTAVVGARVDDPGNVGAAYVFTRTGSAWTQEAKLRPSDGRSLDAFGFSVSLRGDTLAVGARENDNAGGADAGAAYVYWHDQDSWDEVAELLASDGAAGARFGTEVVTSGDRVVVGALWAPGPGSDAGAAYVFGTPPGPNLNAVTPARIEALIPGTAQTIRLAGRSLDLATGLTLDGVAIDPSRYTVVSPELVTLDMPQVATLGAHELAVQAGVTTDRFFVTVVAPASPRYENGSGDPLVPVKPEDGLVLRLGGIPGRTQLIVLSTSPLPSTGRLVSLELGAQFTNVLQGLCLVIPPAAWLEVRVPPVCLLNSGWFGLPVYAQTIDLMPPIPFRTSNLQSFVLQPPLP